MRMNLSEFNAMIAKNPALSARIGSNLKNVADAKRPQKYRNVKVYIYGPHVFYGEKNDKLGKPTAIFDSIKEYERFQELILLEKAGLISKLKTQVNFIISDAYIKNGKRIRAVSYNADFFYFCHAKNSYIVEDVKGFDKKTGKYMTTQVFTLKWKLLQQKYPDYIFDIY